MNEDRATKWVGIATNLAVLAGVILLVVEIRQNNALARLETLQERRYLAQQSEMIFYDPRISAVWVKSVMEPENMTLAEIRTMDAYLAVQVWQLSHIWQMQQAGLMTEKEAIEWIEEDLYFPFGNEFGQIWWKQQVATGGWLHLADVVNPYLATLETDLQRKDFLEIQDTLQQLSGNNNRTDQ